MAADIPEPFDPSSLSPATDRLDSWKEIAAHLKRDVSTVQRWEKREGLPVHRHRHDKLGSVYAFTAELDEWWNQGRLRIEGETAAERRSPSATFVKWRTLSLDAFHASLVVLRASWRPLLAVGLALLMAVAAGVGLGRRSAQTATALPHMTHTLVAVHPADQLSSTPQERRTALRRPSRRAIVLSPDGRLLVFSGVRGDSQQLYLRALDRPEASIIAGTEGGNSPFFSPDGRWIGFWADGKLKKILLGGGPAVVLCQAEPIFGASWGSDGVIVFGEREGLSQVHSEGGNPTSLTTLRSDEFSHRLPFVVPGAKAVLFTVQTRAFRWDDARIEVLVRATGERRRVVQGGSDARYVSTGHLVYVQDGVLMGAPFDLQRLQLAGGAVGVVDEVMQAIGEGNVLNDTGAAQVDVSESGAMAFVSGTALPVPERVPVWVDASGGVQPIDVPARNYSGPRVSPDGGRVAVTHSSDGSGADIWIYDLNRKTSLRLTSAGGNAWPVWTPDGARVAFYTEDQGPSNLFWQPADGSAPAERLTTSPYHQRPASWSPDGKELVFSQSHPRTGGDIWVASVDGQRVSPRPIVEEPFDESFPALSPDGRWLAYTSNASGRNEVYVQPYPGPGAKLVISTTGGREPAWSRSGKRLFYRQTSRQPGGPFTMMAVDVVTGSTLSAGMPKVLFEDGYLRQSPIRSYDVAPDGRFLMILAKQPPPPTPATEVQLVLNWLEVLKRNVPSPR